MKFVYFRKTKSVFSCPTTVPACQTIEDCTDMDRHISNRLFKL